MYSMCWTAELRGRMKPLALHSPRWPPPPPQQPLQAEQPRPTSRRRWPPLPQPLPQRWPPGRPPPGAPSAPAAARAWAPCTSGGGGTASRCRLVKQAGGQAGRSIADTAAHDALPPRWLTQRPAFACGLEAGWMAPPGRAHNSCSAQAAKAQAHDIEAEAGQTVCPRTLMCSRLSTWLRQMGHLLVCLRSSCAHSWHMHLQDSSNARVAGDCQPKTAGQGVPERRRWPTSQAQRGRTPSHMTAGQHGGVALVDEADDAEALLVVDVGLGLACRTRPGRSHRMLQPVNLLQGQLEASAQSAGEGRVHSRRGREKNRSSGAAQLRGGLGHATYCAPRAWRA